METSIEDIRRSSFVLFYFFERGESEHAGDGRGGGRKEKRVGGKVRERGRVEGRTCASIHGALFPLFFSMFPPCSFAGGAAP